MQLFVFTTLTPHAQHMLRHHLPAAVRPVFRQELPTEQQQAAFQQAEVLFGNPPIDWFAAGPPPGLRFWQIDSAGIERYQQLTVDFPVANVGDFFAWPCAETIVAGILGWYRRIPELAVLQSRTEWIGAPIRGRVGLLRHKRVVVLGSGAIGQAVAQQLAGFQCHTRFLARTDPKAQLHSRQELLAALPETDLVVNCLPGSAENFFSAELIQALPAHALYASVGRGNTTDEAALLDALHTGRLAGAVLDVTAQEPLPAAHAFWQMPQVLLTQHSGGGQPGEDEGKVQILLRNLSRLLHKEPLEHLVHLHKGY